MPGDPRDAKPTGGGAVRVPVKFDLSQLSHVGARLNGMAQHEGNVKYGYGNWQKGIPLSNLLTHAMNHLFNLINGTTDDGEEFDWEVELGHAIWNLDKAAHFIGTGRTDLIDIKPLRDAIELQMERLATEAVRVRSDNGDDA